MTWNIHGFLGIDGTSDPARTASVVTRLAPDIVALQEVDSRDHGHGPFDGFAHFRSLGHSDVVEAFTISDGDGHYGHMLASRWPIDSEETHDISVPGREPRRLIDAYIDVPGGPLRVVTSHFGVRARERRGQIAKLREILAADTETPVVLMGDFNEWRHRGPLRRMLGREFGTARAPVTFPAHLPFLPLDRIWSRPAGLVERVWTEAGTRQASDHLPLVADLDWPDGDPAATGARPDATSKSESVTAG